MRAEPSEMELVLMREVAQEDPLPLITSEGTRKTLQKRGSSWHPDLSLAASTIRINKFLLFVRYPVCGILL